MVSAEETTLTDKQLEMVELREEGLTQRKVAEVLVSTDSNVSAVKRAAQRNVEEASPLL